MRIPGKTIRYSTLLALACLLPILGSAQEVGLAGMMGSRALLMINGGEPQPVRIGETLEGVKLLSIQGEQVLVEIDGKKRALRIGQHAVGTSAGDGTSKIVLTADAQGHFYTTGTINGASIRFVVDTGASMISLGASDAKRMGLDFAKGERGVTMTANGQSVVSKVQLNTVRVGDVTMNNVDALILQTEMPVALLGMSFLNRMEMMREGDKMTLKKRF